MSDNGNKKVSILGAGAVGATCARTVSMKGLADVVLVDVVEGLAEGKALDMMESAPLEGFRSKVTGTTDLELMKGSDIVVVTAGLSRRPGMSRDDLLAKNTEIVKGLTGKIAGICPDTTIIMVTNPLDVMCYTALKESGFPKARVIGMSGVLDSSRCRYFISELTGTSSAGIEATVMGAHGDSMVFISRLSKVDGKPLADVLTPEQIEAVSERTKKAGAEIVGLLKTGSAFYSTASAITEMIGAIFLKTGRVLPASVYLEGEYGLSDVFCGVPVRIGSGGAEEIIKIDLTGEERAELHLSAAKTKETILKTG